MASPQKKTDKIELWEIKNLPYFCSDGHREAEMVSTDVMKWMCKEHVPVWLFGLVDDPIFQEHHLEASTPFFP